MGLILLRYGEIGLKGQNRLYFERKLRHNVRQCLKANGVPGDIWQEGQRLYLATDQVEAAIEAVQRVFGLVSLSPVFEVPADLEAIGQEAIRVASRTGLGPERSFHVRARRSDKSFPHRSPEIERWVGGQIVEATGARVDLSKGADVEIGIEVQRGRALVFGETFPGVGGLPLSSQGRVVVLLSHGIDSPVAAWLMMKRGCGVIPVHFSSDLTQTAQVEAIVEALNRYAYGWKLRPIILSHQEIVDPLVARLRKIREERWACIVCKRALLMKAAEIADEMGAKAIVTGDSLGQVASQTLDNLEAISWGIPKLILRPLIGMDKVEIMALARRIGTYEPSIQASPPCPFLPKQPLTQASLPKLQAVIEQMEVGAEPEPGCPGSQG
ncbi:MAG: tRNA uracil 4-sulfurtransferase ThiI [Anaerolineae bacterium]